jgi:putative iron-dependent peroxidase
VKSPQSGVFALGTASHAYLELDATGPADALVAAVCSLREPRTTMGGVNLVAGFRPELWRDVAPDDAPPHLHGFNQDLVGSDGYTMPATQHDAVLWLSGSAYDVIFDTARQAIAALDPIASVAEETSSWPYRHDRDLTGFVDGSENPSLIDAAELTTISEGRPGAGGSILLLQRWSHDADAWESLTIGEQERVIGRTKDDSVELDEDEMPPSAHVARTTIEKDGEEFRIFRRNVAYGGVTDHGTAFVGFARDRWRMHEMLRRMAGATDRIRDGLTHWLIPLTGAYYTVPSVESLARFAPPDED